MNRNVRLNHDLIGYVPVNHVMGPTIPEGSEIEITNSDYSDIDSEVLWNGVTLLVNKNSLITFEEHD
jgi:hypothetical protein